MDDIDTIKFLSLGEERPSISFSVGKKVIRDHIVADKENAFVGKGVFFCDANSVIEFIEDVFFCLHLFPRQGRKDTAEANFMSTQIKDIKGNILVEDLTRLNYLDPRTVIERKINKSNYEHYKTSVETIAKKRAYYTVCGFHPVGDDNDGNFSAVGNNQQRSKDDYRNKQ